MGHFFGGFQSSRPPGAGVAPRPNIGPEIAQHHDCGGSFVRLGLLIIKICFFLKVYFT